MQSVVLDYFVQPQEYKKNRFCYLVVSSGEWSNGNDHRQLGLTDRMGDLRVTTSAFTKRVKKRVVQVLRGRQKSDDN